MVPDKSEILAMTTNDVWFDNPVLGQRVRFSTLPADTDGRRFVVEYINGPSNGQPSVPAHVHTAYVETFDVLAGRARYRLASDTKTAVAGDRIVMPAGMPHVHPWSDGDEDLHVRQVTEADPPDLRGLNASLQAAITILGLARSGRLNAKGCRITCSLPCCSRRRCRQAMRRDRRFRSSACCSGCWGASVVSPAIRRRTRNTV